MSQHLWMTPGGRLIDAGNHVMWAKNHLRSKGVELSDVDDYGDGVYDTMFKRGFVRVVISGGTLSADTRASTGENHPIKPKILKELKDCAIERGLALAVSTPQGRMAYVESALSEAKTLVWIGYVRHGRVKAKRVDVGAYYDVNGETPMHAGMGLYNGGVGRWRYQEGTDRVFWWTPPSELDKEAVDSFMQMHKLPRVRHYTAVDPDTIEGTKTQQRKRWLQADKDYDVAHGIGGSTDYPEYGLKRQKGKVRETDEAVTEAQELATWLLEANPAKRLEYLVQKYSKPVADALDYPTAALFTELTQKRVRDFLQDIVYVRDPTQGDYAEWIVRNWLKLDTAKKYRWDEDAYKVHDDLELFHKYKAKLPPEMRDINKRDFNWLAHMTMPPDAGSPHGGPLYNQDMAAKEKDQTQLAANDVEVLLDSRQWLIIIPKTKAASIKYGQGTRWCTASEQYSYYEQYTKDGPLFIIIKKGSGEGGREEKWQLHFQSDQFMDAGDNAQDPEGFFIEQWAGVGEAIAKWIKVNFSPGEYSEYIAIVAPNVVFDLIDENAPTAVAVVQKTSIFVLAHGITDKIITPEKLNPYLAYAVEFTPTTLKFGADGSELVECFNGSRRSNSQAMAQAFFSDGDSYFDDFEAGSQDWRELRDHVSEEQQARIKALITANFEMEEDKDWEDYVDEDDEVSSALDTANRYACQAAAESELYDAVKSAFENRVGRLQNGGVVNGKSPEWSVEIPYRDLQEVYKERRENSETAKITPSNIGGLLPDNIEVQEPQYGFSGFDKEHFVETLDDQLYEVEATRERQQAHAHAVTNEPQVAEAQKLAEEKLA